MLSRYAVAIFLAACAGRSPGSAPPPSNTAAPAPVASAAGAGEPSHAHDHHDQGHHAHHAHGHHGDHGHNHHHDQPPTADHRFEDPAYWSKVFDDPQRDEWQRPRELVSALSIAANETVVDLGAGTGYMVPHLSRAVPKGRVLAIDVEPSLLRHIDERVKKAGLPNVATRLASKTDPNLTEKVDLVLLVDAYHHIGGRTAYFRRVAEKLTAGGRVVVVDFRLGKLPVGPGDDHKLAPEVVTREMAAVGYTLCQSWDKLPYQYVLIFALRCSAPAR